MTNYDYTPVPNYVAPTQGNMEQAATQIANWLRTKGNGADARESLAQAVQLFGDVAAQFINEASGLKGQFNSAVANANTNSEVEAARTSTVSGTGYTTLGARLDALDTEQASHDSELKTARQSYSSLSSREDAQDSWIKTVQNSISDTGWLTAGVTFGTYVTANDFRYRIIKIGSFQQMIFEGSFALNTGILRGNWGSFDRYLFKLPAGYTALNDTPVQYFVGHGHSGIRADLIYRQVNGDGIMYAETEPNVTITDGYISDVSGSIFLTEADS